MKSGHRFVTPLSSRPSGVGPAFPGLLLALGVSCAAAAAGDGPAPGGGAPGATPAKVEPAPARGEAEPAPAREDSGREGFLADVVVSATSRAEESFRLPYSVDLLEGEALAHRKAFRTLPEALRELPGVMVQKTGYGQGSPFIRGFTGFRTLLLIDGVRLNNAVMRDGPNQYWNTIDPLTIDRLELVRGPSSVLYGSDAIGGTVNVVTRSARPGPDRHGPFDWKRRAYYRFASAEDSHTGRGELSATIDQSAGFLGGFSYRDFGDLSAGRDIGLLPRTGYHELDGDFKATLALRPDLDLVLAFQRNALVDAPRTHSTIFSRSFRGTDVGRDFRRDLDQTRHLGYAQIHWRPEDIPWLTRLSYSLSYHLQEETEHRTKSNARRRVQGFEDGTLGTWFQLESPSPAGTWTYGVEFYHDDVDSFFREYETDGSLRQRRPRGPVADDSTYDLLAAYVQDSVRPVDPVEIIVGGRFNWASAQADAIDPDPASDPVLGGLDEDFASLVGSARAVYTPLEAWSLFGGVSQGFRAPNLSDLTRFDVARSGEVETPAPGLDPEKFLSFEVGSKLRLRPWKVDLQAAYHYTLIDGMIVRIPTGRLIEGDPEVTKDNIGDGWVHGFELAASWNFYGGFSLFGNVSWIEGQVDTFAGGANSREPLSRLQPAMGLAGLRWRSDDGRYWVEGTMLVADNQDRLSPRDAADTQRIPPGGTPGYTVYGLRAGAEVYEGLNVFAGVENLTGVDYRTHGSGQNEPGTNVVLGLDWTF